MVIVAGLFDTWDEAQQALEALRRAGFHQEELSIVGRDRRLPGPELEADAAAVAAETGMGAGAATGAIGGGILGGLAGLVVGVGALTVPGIGLALAAGPLSATLSGGALGAATGGLLGALADLGLSAADAHDYHAGVARGGILLTVQAPAAREAEARILLRQNGLRDLDEHRRRWEEDSDYCYDSRSEPVPIPLDAAAPATVPARATTPAPPVLAERPTAARIDIDHEGLVLAGGATGAIVGGILGGLAAGPAGAAVGVAIGAVAGGATGAACDTGGVASAEEPTGPEPLGPMFPRQLAGRG